jgi:DNA adenine methylase
MRYYGGKGVHGKKIAHFLMSYLIDEIGIDLSKVIYAEPFCGALGVFRYICPHVKKTIANDLSKDLILLWKSVQQSNYKNPHIDEIKWRKLKAETKPSADRAFAGFGCSFGGVWFNGYICDHGNNDMTYHTLVKMQDIIEDTTFVSVDYKTFLKKIIKDPKQIYVIYMDPPYKNTCTIPYTSSFDSSEFWDTVRVYSKLKNVIIVTSELSAPKDFKEIFNFQRRSGMSNTSNITSFKEKLFVLKQN